MPTLLEQGNLKDPQNRASVQRKFDKYERPIDYIIERYNKSMDSAGAKHKIFVLKAETASGKSTANVAETFLGTLVPSGEQKLIIVTQPKIITAITNVHQILQYYSDTLTLGKNIGWSTGNNKYKTRERPAIMSVTVGTLRQQLQNWTDDEIIDTYRFIMIDETHERSIDIDVTLFMLKSLYQRNHKRKDFPFIVLMSATFDPQPFLTYFEIPEDNFIYVTGASNPININWTLKEPSRNIPQTCAEIVKHIALEKGKDDTAEECDVLVFLPGKVEIQACATAVDQVNRNIVDQNPALGLSVLRLDGDATRTHNEDYKKLFMESRSYKETVNGKTFTPSRRVVLSTSVAETGLTLDNLKYVLDMGVNREMDFNPHFNLSILATKPAPQSRIIQRRGRAGRKFAGEFYPMYPKSIYDQLLPQQFPDIITNDFSPYIIGLLQDQIKSRHKAGEKRAEFNVGELDMVSQVPTDHLHTALERAYNLGQVSPCIENKPGAFDKEDIDPEYIAEHFKQTTSPHFGVTPIGFIMNRFSKFRPEIIRMILAGFCWGSSILDLITIGAYLETTRIQRKGHIPLKWNDVYAESGIIHAAHLKLGNPNANYQGTRAIICDDFIEGIILYEAMAAQMKSGKIVTAAPRIDKFIYNVGANAESLREFIKTRDDLIEQCAGIGLALFNNEQFSLYESKNTEAFMNRVVALKHCIYDGFKCNYLVASGEYYNGVGQLIVSANPLRDIPAGRVRPKYILYDKLSTSTRGGNGLYTISAPRVSTMSGYVAVDTDFME